MTLTTEDEAKTKWCPFSRDVTGDDNGVAMAMATCNRPFSSQFNTFETCNCIASECMAWRQVDTDPDNEQMNPQYMGYCGLAGKP